MRTDRKRVGPVFMMDLLTIVPYYTAYLSQALSEQGVEVRVGAITYYLDRECFCGRNLKLDPGLLNVVGRVPSLPAMLRRLAKFAETVVNLTALFVRFMIRPPAVMHVQYLGLLRTPLPLDLLLVKAVRWRGVPIVLTVHDLLPHDTGDKYRNVFADLYATVDRLICHSDYIRDRLMHDFAQPPVKIDVIPHGPLFYDMSSMQDDQELRERYRVPAQQQIVLWQGILLPYKGLDLLLEAWQTVERNNNAGTLVVVGTGSAEYWKEIKEKARDLQLRRVVFEQRFVSAQEVVALYRAATMVVYPYRAITTSGAVATGLAMCKALIASDLPVFRELLKDGKDAILVRPGDVSELSDAMLRLLTDRELRERLIMEGRRRDFGSRTWNKIAAETKSVYERVLQNKGITDPRINASK